ncbi:MAG: MFS transporter [Actinobacteria bacterium 69-20]|jgi:EmrB/QacA subfamily drug resistance transporter|nr:DHA2 family efflux MFS transporter permease subunit [Actinomycetota bacterium]OJV26919.1 MAG: MFS transporter [Actinobacteria bacterium 69-20]
MIPLASVRGRWLVAVAVLGSGIAFLDGTVVTVALPAIGKDLATGLAGQQWVVDGYLLTLGALLLAGGAAGDRYGRRRVFLTGLAAFAVASAACALAPTGIVLIGARVVQGVAAAALIPGSLALINALIAEADRARAIGLWAGMSGVTSALGPFLGGYLVDAASWRWVFVINVPLATVAIYLAVRHVPESRDAAAAGPFDISGALLATAGLAGVVYALIEGPAHGWRPASVVCAIAGVLALAGFLWREFRAPAALLPPKLFASRQFSGANMTTFVVYAALGASSFLLTLQLQQTLGYSALAAGAATVPITVVMLLGSPSAGVLAGRVGPRLPMTIGPIIAGAGLVMMALIVPGRAYVTAVLPAVMVFAIGLTITVTPLTAAVLAAVPQRHVGAASGVNNAISRIGGLLAVAVLPAVAAITAAPGEPLGPGFARAMIICAALCVAGGLISALTIPGRPQPSTRPPVPSHDPRT